MRSGVLMQKRRCRCRLFVFDVTVAVFILITVAPVPLYFARYKVALGRRGIISVLFLLLLALEKQCEQKERHGCGDAYKAPRRAGVNKYKNGGRRKQRGYDATNNSQILIHSKIIPPAGAKIKLLLPVVPNRAKSPIKMQNSTKKL